MSSNVESPRRDFDDSLYLTNSILDSGVTCHMTPEISDFVPVSLVETDTYVEFSGGKKFIVKQIG